MSIWIVPGSAPGNSRAFKARLYYGYPATWCFSPVARKPCDEWRDSGAGAGNPDLADKTFDGWSVLWLDELQHKLVFWLRWIGRVLVAGV